MNSDFQRPEKTSYTRGFILMTPELRQSLSEFEGDQIESFSCGDLRDILDELAIDELVDWLDGQIEFCRLELKLDDALFLVDDNQAAESEPWRISISQAFRNSIKSLSKNLKGRIMEAIIDLGEAPITPSGDTVKPLTGELKGIWRYRIADYRLVYRPDIEKKIVQILLVKPRGDVYD